jgi:hypothetical protein
MGGLAKQYRAWERFCREPPEGAGLRSPRLSRRSSGATRSQQISKRSKQQTKLLSASSWHHSVPVNSSPACFQLACDRLGSL